MSANKKRVLTDQQKAFLEALGGEAAGNIRMAMDIAGYSKNTKQQEILQSLKEEITDTALNIMAGSSVEAVYGLLNTLRDPSTIGASNRINAAKELLDRAGLVKKEQIEVKTDGGGLFILPPKRREEDN